MPETFTHCCRSFNGRQNLFATFILMLAILQLSDAVSLLPPPHELTLPLDTHHMFFVGGGPTNSYTRSIAALQRPVMGNFENTTLEMMDQVKKGLRYLFQTENNWTLALTGGGSFAIETMLDNLIEPGDVVLVPLCAYWGPRTADFASRLGAEVQTISKPFGRTFTLKEIEDGIIKYKPKIVYLTNAESSTGMRQKVEGVGELCRKHDCLLLLDMVATIGIIPFHFDAWKVDAAICNSQKAIGAPTGLAPITFGPRAMEKIMARKTKPKSFVTDLKNVWIPSNYWQMVDESKPPIFLSSYPVLQLYAMRESLATIAEEGLEAGWLRHETMSKRMNSGLDKLGLVNFVKDPEDWLVGTVALEPPQGIDPTEFTDYVMMKFGIEFDIGMGPTLGKMIRIGVFGINANNVTVDKSLAALEDGLKYFKRHE